ncbi:hypothetical protein AGLY_014113 [Aphis glycines]|uniref:Uncharacterized protein n=1 Tax=Aphis glycines TaxID=307491 RepID=A0A6G0T509_APHGL|nr:hypothetical protein AGLY_014113 [Aphis glycines]
MQTTLLRELFVTDFRLWLKGMTLFAILLVVSLTVIAWTVAAVEWANDLDGDGDGAYGAGGLKEAIQDLYAEIVESESVDGGDSPNTPRLDDVASAKAKFVSDSLRRMIGNGETTTGGGGDGTAVERTLRDKKKEVIDALKLFGAQNGVDERAMDVVDLLLDKCVEIALANRAAAETTTPSPVDMDELERHFHQMLDQFERSTESAAAMVCGRGVHGHHKSRKSRSSAAPPTTKQPTTPRPRPPTTKPTRPPRRPSSRSVGRFRVSQLQSERPPSDVRFELSQLQSERPPPDVRR